jgi:carotenoid 1,2-hydratase
MHPRHADPAGRLWPDAGGTIFSPAADPDGLRAAVSGDGWSPLWTGLARVGGVLPPARQPDSDPWALLRGRGDSSWRGRADGRLVGSASERGSAGRPRFDATVAPGGYHWWYIDALSDDGRYGLTIIAFIGSVFSPYYKQSGRGVPVDHSCLNIALYGRSGARWVMTERGAGDTAQQRDALSIGPSAVRWDQDRLIIDIEERDVRLGVPWRRRVAGQIIVHPEALNNRSFALDPAGQHHWQAIAPRARIEVRMTAPALAWSGSAYCDSNHGREPLEAGFHSWHWSRAHLGRSGARGDVAVIYEGVRRDGSQFGSALRFDASGTPHEEDLPLVAPLPRTWWAMARQTRADRGCASIVKTWEDSPFYARSTVASRLWGEPVVAVQESISLNRLINPVVQWMLPYKMPREATRE